VHALVDGEAPTRFTSARSDGPAPGDGARGRDGIEEVGLDELEALVLLDAFELALGHPGHDHTPAVLEEGAGDGSAEAACPSGDEDGAIAHSLHSSDVRARPYGCSVLVRDLTAGQDLDQVLLVRACEPRTRRDGTQLLKLSLGDRSGQVAAIVRDPGPSCASCAGPAARSTCAGATSSIRASARRSS
jgi:hypothetical protein